MRNIQITLAYDGTSYLGWQKTNMGASIESTVQSKLEQILQHAVKLQAASRTDAGVHATGQIVNFKTIKENLEPIRLLIGLNALLPKDISAMDIRFVHANFHPTLDCKGKEYQYAICFGRAQMPMHRLYSWHFPHPLAFEIMRKSAHFLIGTYDFEAFSNIKKNESYTHTTRTISNIEIKEQDNQRLLIKISGNSFLYKMVRNIVGTLAYTGCGKLQPEDVPIILSSCDRTKAGMTAPAHGLTLSNVFY